MGCVFALSLDIFSQASNSLQTKKEAEHVVSAVIRSLETTLLSHLGTDGFTLKLDSFGKFYVHHRPGIRRKSGPQSRRSMRAGSAYRGRFMPRSNSAKRGSE